MFPRPAGPALEAVLLNTAGGLTGGDRMLVEPVIFGRKAMGEVMRNAQLRDRWEVRVGGKLCFADALWLSGDLATQLSRTGAAGAMVTVLYVGPDAAAFLSGLRKLLPPTAEASLIRDSVLFARMLGADGFDLRTALIPVLEYLGGAPLPKVWRL